MDNQYKDQRKGLPIGSVRSKQDYINKRMQAEAAKAAAGWSGIRSSKSRDSSVTSRFRQSHSSTKCTIRTIRTESFTTRATNIKGVNLAGYQVDPALIGGDQSIANRTDTTCHR